MENEEELANNNIENNIEEQYIINTSKFIVLSIATFGVYGTWWTYKAWRFYQQKENLDIQPTARAIFSIFFLHSLFEKNLSFAQEKGYQENYSSTGLFAGILLVSVLSVLPEPFWLVSLLGFIFFVPAFNALNYAKENSTNFVVIEQDSFNGKQIGLLVVGFILWALILLGAIAGDVEA